MTPETGAPPSIIPVDGHIFYTSCECQKTVDNSAPSGNTGVVGDLNPPGGGNDLMLMVSDAGLVTGEFYQDHPIVTYQSQGQDQGIDLQYSSLQADPRPVVQIELITPTGATPHRSPKSRPGSASTVVASAPRSPTLPSTSPTTSPIASPSRSTPSGWRPNIYPDEVQITKTWSGGATQVEQFYGAVNVVDAASSPVGAGWSIGGLEHVWTGGANNVVLITAGQMGTAAFAYVDGIHYTPPIGDTSTLTQNSGGTWTRTFPDGTVLQFNSSGQETSSTDRNGNVTSFGYLTSGPAAGALQTITDPVGLVTTLAYDSSGHLNKITDPANRVTTITVDSNGNLTQITDPDGAVTQYGYTTPSNHLLTSETNPNNHTATATYDSFDRLQSETLFDGTSTVQVNGGQEKGLLAAGGSGPLPLPSGFQGNVTDPDGNTTTLTFDIDEHPTVYVDAMNETTTITYNSNQWPATITDPLGRVTSYAYDLVGNVTQVTDRLGRVTDYGYDADNRETSEDWVSGGANIHTTSYTYDSGGRMTGVVDHDNTSGITIQYSFGYDPANRLTSVDNAGTTSMPHVLLTYSYDKDGNTTGLDDNFGGLTSSTYDTRDELVTLTQSGTGVQSKSADFTYDAAGRLTNLTRYADITGTTKTVVTTYAYDTADRLTGITDTNAGGTVLSQYAYTLDNANRLTQEVRSWTSGGSLVSDTLTYSYTNNDQLTGVSHTNSSFANETYTYDQDGNRSGTTVGKANEVTKDGTYSYTYDAEGNLVTKTQISSGNETIYKYDYRDRLIEVDTKPSGGSQTVVATFVYDPFDRQIEAVSGGTTRWTAYDGDEPILDFSGGSQTPTARYLWDTALGQILARDSGGSTAWYLTDREGTVRDLASNSGSIIDHIDYTSYGQIIDESNSSVGDRFKYAGLEYDSATGLDMAIERVYDPGSGRWLQRDPIGFVGGDVNLYRYVGNSPTDRTDPLGMRWGDPNDWGQTG